jgi:hypothetical protein
MRRHGAASGDAKRKKNDTRLPLWRRKKKKPSYLYYFLFIGDTKMQTQAADNNARSNCVLCLGAPLTRLCGRIDSLGAKLDLRAFSRRNRVCNPAMSANGENSLFFGVYRGKKNISITDCAIGLESGMEPRDASSTWHGL